MMLFAVVIKLTVKIKLKNHINAQIIVERYLIPLQLNSSNKTVSSAIFIINKLLKHRS